MLETYPAETVALLEAEEVDDPCERTDANEGAPFFYAIPPEAPLSMPDQSF
jgi:hypothetical protein